jgi:hypothetical protein
MASAAPGGGIGKADKLLIRKAVTWFEVCIAYDTRCVLLVEESTIHTNSISIFETIA